MSLLVGVLATLGEPQSDEARELQQQELTSPGFDCLQAALEALAARTAERTGRGVEGTEQP
jgi:hypothetical protein